MSQFRKIDFFSLALDITRFMTEALKKKKQLRRLNQQTDTNEQKTRNLKKE